jgi:hypothetical protein
VINPNVPGSYNLQYKAVDGSGNMAATFFATVVVKDLVPPTVTLIGANPLTVDVFTTFNDPGVTAIDNYYPSLIVVKTGIPIMNTLGTSILTYTVTDGAGNTTVVTRTVNVVDRIEPQIQLLGANPLTHIRFTPYVDPGVKLNDNYYSDAALRNLLITDDSELDVDVPGLYFVTYSLTDPSNNTAKSVKRLINVVEFTSMDELAGERKLSVYPNPTDGKFTITPSSAATLTEIKMMDVLGRTVKVEQYGNGQMDISEMHKGVYILIATDEEGHSYSTKIVLE